MKAEEFFWRLVISVWQECRANPHVPDDIQRMLSQLNAVYFLQYIALPMRRYMTSLINDHLTLHEKIKFYLSNLENLMLFEQLSFRDLLIPISLPLIISFGIAFLVFPYLGMSPYVIFIIYLSLMIYETITRFLAKRNNLNGFKNKLFRIMCNPVTMYTHTSDRSLKQRIVLSIFAKHRFPGNYGKENAGIASERLFKAFMKNPNYSKIDILHELAQGLYERRVDVLTNFFRKITLPVLQSKIKALIETSQQILKRSHELSTSVIAKLFNAESAVSLGKHRHFARSYGGITSEVSILFTLIVSLACSEPSAISLDAQRVYALREEIGYGV